MPLRINEILFNNDEEEKVLMDGLLNMIRSQKPDAFFAKENGIKMVVFNLADHFSKQTVLRCVYTLQEDSDATNSIIDIDFVIPNEKVTELNFLQILEDNAPANEEWNVEYDESRTYAETVNRNLIDGDIQGLHKVSLSLMPYELVAYGENMDIINKALGFTPMVYPWQEELNLGSEPLSVGYAENFVGMGLMVAKVLSHQQITFSICRQSFSAIIARLKTGYGEIPAIFSVAEKEKIIDGHYLMISASLKADFSCDSLNYYDKTK